MKRAWVACLGLIVLGTANLGGCEDDRHLLSWCAGKTLYENSLNTEGDLADWMLTGDSELVSWRIVGDYLRYTNGMNYEAPTRNSGSALTPEIDLGGVSSAELSFRCDYDTEIERSGVDLRVVRIWGTSTINKELGIKQIEYASLTRTTSDTIDSPTKSLAIVQPAGQVVLEVVLGTPEGDRMLGPCGAPGAWHTHTLPLYVLWERCRIEFVFDTIDEIDNKHGGWGVDDIRVEGRTE